MIKIIKIIIVVLIIGLGGGYIAWQLTPQKWKVDNKTSYLMMLSIAQDLQRNGDFLGSENALRSAIQIDARRYEAYLFLGDLLLAKHETNSAIENYKAAFSYCGNSPTNFISSEAQTHEKNLIERKIQQLQKNVNN